VSTAASQAAIDGVMAQLAARKRWRFPQIALAAVLIAFLVWCAEGVNLRPKAVAEAVPVIAEYFARMAPPKWEFSEVLWKPAAETLYIALWGNVIALIIGLPLGVLAASNVTRSPLVRHSARAVLNLLRSISELIWAVFFVAAVGLGPFPGALALGVNFGGILGRLYADDELCQVVGRHCESGDVLVRDAPLARPRVGDLLVLPVTGAYCHTMANNYNGNRRPPVVFASGGAMRAVVRRETWDDLLSRDVLS